MAKPLSLASKKKPKKNSKTGISRAAWRGKTPKLTTLLDKYVPSPAALRAITSAEAPGFTPLDLAVATRKRDTALLLLERMQVDYHALDHLDLKSRTMREARELLDYRGKGTGRKRKGSKRAEV